MNDKHSQKHSSRLLGNNRSQNKRNTRLPRAPFQVQHFFLGALFLLALLMTAPGKGLAQEQEFNLEDVPAPSLTRSVTPTQQPKSFLMGRVDLTTELNRVDSPESSQGQIENYHFLVFLKVKASPKTQFMGEIVAQSFFAVNYQAFDSMEVEFGKILVPFGDTRRFHHFYGGVQGLGANGLMFKNIWAESGANLKWNLSHSELETYVVDSISDGDSSDPSLQSTLEPNTQQAIGARWTASLGGPLTFIGSLYRGEYQPGRAIELVGLDLYSDYGGLGLTQWRFNLGAALAQFKRTATVSGQIDKRGDYLEVWTNSLGHGEARIRYGTYVDNTKLKSQKDTHSFNLAYLFPVDAMRILTEYQWNFEAVNEINNDLARVMVSLDF